LDETAAKAVKELLPESAEGDLSSLCLWADRVKFRYHWSSPLHYINTPHFLCFGSKGDCKDESGEKGRCVAGAIYNYTTQLLSYKTAASSQSQCSTKTLPSFCFSPISSSFISLLYSVSIFPCGQTT